MLGGGREGGVGPSWSQFVAYSAKTHYEGYNAAEGGPGHATKRSLRKAHCNQSLRRRVRREVAAEEEKGAADEDQAAED